MTEKNKTLLYMHTSFHKYFEEKAIRDRYVCPFVVQGYSCPKEYANKYSPGAFRHFHVHLQDARCTGNAKEIMLKYARENGIMKALKNKGHVKVDLVAG